jgi:isoquinoline 1-oxidoreductase subunit alpha
MKLVVNGKPVDITTPAETSLLWVLREEVGLTGTKFGCGIAVCGACTVHSCADHQITTIEGMAGGDGALHPLQQAWIDENVPQCGYCQSGQIMSAAALLAQKPNPTDQEIDAVMSANLCRCGTYPRIRLAVQRAAATMRGEALPSSGSGGVK